ncbi:MAG TPA: GAF domain-containing protein, partial [Prolixibacteraceae bacterium]|nr:GAF domain-containing protein [Prolixibacteraceae bacterium]
MINHPSEYHFNKQTELAHFIFEASNIGTWSWNIATDEISLDEKWFSIKGYSSDDFSSFDRDNWKTLCHPEDISLINEAIIRHINGKSNFFEVEYRMKHQQGHWVWVLDRGKILEYSPEGKPLIIIGSHQDITNRKEKEIELVLEEARLESLLRISQHPTNSIYEMLDYALNEAITLTGSKIGYIYFYDEETKEFTLNTWSKEVMQVCTIIEPKTIYHLEKTGIWGEVVRQRKPIINNDYRAPNEYKKGYPEGHAPLLRFLSVPTFDQDRIVAVVGVANKYEEYNNSDVRQLTLMMDSVWKIVKRREAEEKLTRANRLYAVISQINQAIVLNNDRHSLFNRICQIIVEYGKFAMAWIGEPDRETQQIMPVAIAGNDNGYLSFAPKISAANVPEGNGPAGTAFRENRISVCNDIANDPDMAIWRDEALKRNFRSAIGLPLSLYGKPAASITIYSSQINFFNAEEIKLLEEVVSDISFALNAIETDLQHQETISALAESEERFRMFAESSPVGGLIYDSSGNIRFLSPRITKMLGYTPNDIPTLDSWFLKAYPNDDYREFVSEKWFYATNESMKSGEPMQPLEFKVTGKDGKQLNIEFRAEVNPEICFVTLSDITSRKRAEHLANERMKELSAFYKLSELSEKKPFNLETFYADFVNEFPKSFQYPEITAVQLVVGEKTYSTPNFTGKGEMLISPLVIDSTSIGHLTVTYLEEKPEEAIGPFLFEERLLTDGIAERISKLTERNYAEEQLIESETKFRSLVNQMQVGLAV